MALGCVKWFNEAKGFGFITGDDKKQYFVHFSQIQTDGFKTLSEGDRIDFTPMNNAKGLCAEKVKKVQD